MQSFPRLFFAAVLFGVSMPGCGGEQSDGNGAKRGMIPKRSSKPAPQTVQPSVAGPEEKPLRKPTQHALLVGCTIYDNLPISAQLMGATNDVELMANLLTGTFDFPEKNVRQLSERTGKRADRPLRANICREFEQLTKRAGKGDRVVVLLSGHGTQQPDDDPDNADDPEPDGMDEVFCPADLDMDFAPGAKGIPNAVTDDELRGWLQAIRERGASVWVVVDACHSGTSVRGTEVLRQIAPEQLLPREVLDAARPVSSTRGIHSETDALDGETDTGGLVAIYAAQPHEPTVEMRLPRNAADGQWHGLLTYTLVKVLTEAESKLTYTELVQRIHAEYVSSRRIGPTPLIEGSDRHREVLGKQQWPERSRLVLKSGRGGILELGAGSLHGLTVGTILAVYPPPGEKESEQPLGHVRIRRLRLAESIVEPCAYDPLPLRKDLPLGGRCEVVHWEYGDLRLRVAVDVSEADDTSEANA
ncbi:MAG: caspase family protein, partial [Planctomycetes bacterium]|nr:caspase family protein [Planctomycetota bacterium]